MPAQKIANGYLAGWLAGWLDFSLHFVFIMDELKLSRQQWDWCCKVATFRQHEASCELTWILMKSWWKECHSFKSALRFDMGKEIREESLARLLCIWIICFRWHSYYLYFFTVYIWLDHFKVPNKLKARAYVLVTRFERLKCNVWCVTKCSFSAPLKVLRPLHWWQKIVTDYRSITFQNDLSVYFVMSLI